MADALVEVRYVRSRAMSALLPASGRKFALLRHVERDGGKDEAEP